MKDISVALRDEEGVDSHQGPPFKLTCFDFVGFDLDHTLVRYDLRELDEHIFKVVARYLVDAEGYCKMLLEAYSPDLADFAFKGLILDTRNGNLLKLDCQNRVSRAYFGLRELSPSEIEEAYPYALTEFEGVATPRFFPLITFFERPCGCLYAILVDGKYDPDLKEKLSHKVRLQHIVTAIYFNYSGNGYYFTSIYKDVGRFVFKRYYCP